MLHSVLQVPISNLNTLKAGIFNKSLWSYSSSRYSASYHVWLHPVAINCDWSCSCLLSFTALHFPGNCIRDSSFYYVESALPPHFTATQTTGVWRQESSFHASCYRLRKTMDLSCLWMATLLWIPALQSSGFAYCQLVLVTVNTTLVQNENRNDFCPHLHCCYLHFHFNNRWGRRISGYYANSSY